MTDLELCVHKITKFLINCTNKISPASVRESQRDSKNHHGSIILGQPIELPKGWHYIGSICVWTCQNTFQIPLNDIIDNHSYNYNESNHYQSPYVISDHSLKNVEIIKTHHTNYGTNNNHSSNDKYDNNANAVELRTAAMSNNDSGGNHYTNMSQDYHFRNSANNNDNKTRTDMSNQNKNTQNMTETQYNDDIVITYKNETQNEKYNDNYNNNSDKIKNSDKQQQQQQQQQSYLKQRKNKSENNDLKLEIKHDSSHRKTEKELKIMFDKKSTVYRTWFEFMLFVTLLITSPLLLIVGLCIVILVILKGLLNFLEQFICTFICCCWCFGVSRKVTQKNSKNACKHTVCGECCHEHSF